MQSWVEAAPAASPMGRPNIARAQHSKPRRDVRIHPLVRAQDAAAYAAETEMVSILYRACNGLGWQRRRDSASTGSRRVGERRARPRATMAS